MLDAGRARSGGPSHWLPGQHGFSSQCCPRRGGLEPWQRGLCIPLLNSYLLLTGTFSWIEKVMLKFQNSSQGQWEDVRLHKKLLAIPPTLPGNVLQMKENMISILHPTIYSTNTCWGYNMYKIHCYRINRMPPSLLSCCVPYIVLGTSFALSDSIPTTIT